LGQQCHNLLIDSFHVKRIPAIFVDFKLSTMVQIAQLVLIMPHRISSLVKSATVFFGPVGLVLLLASLAWGTELIISDPALPEPQAARERVTEEPLTDGIGSGAVPSPDQALEPFTPPLSVVPQYSIPQNEKVNRFLAAFQSPKKREVVDRWLSRSGRYLEMIQEVFRQKGLPEDLAVQHNRRVGREDP